MHTDLPGNLERLSRLAAGLGIELFAFKGLGARATYPDPGLRDFNDLDLFVRARPDASRLSRRLRESYGYTYNEVELPWLKYEHTSNLVYGQINLVAPSETEHLNVDLHFGDYSVRHCGRLGLGDALPLKEPGLYVVDPEENLACGVNNGAGDYYITAKDLNDIIMALSLPGFDTERFAARLRRGRLTGFFGYMAGWLREVAVLTPSQASRLAEMPLARTLEPKPALERPHWGRRCLGTTMHAFMVQRPAGAMSALRVALNGYSYYRKPLELQLTRDAGREPETIKFNPWTCVRLLPLDLATRLGYRELPGRAAAPGIVNRAEFASDPGIERIDMRAGSLLRVDGEMFVPTVSYQVNADLIRAAQLVGPDAG